MFQDETIMFRMKLNVNSYCTIIRGRQDPIVTSIEIEMDWGIIRKNMILLDLICCDRWISRIRWYISGDLGSRILAEQKWHVL